jgi:hypothetical protein
VSATGKEEVCRQLHLFLSNLWQENSFSDKFNAEKTEDSDITTKQ